MKEIRTLKANEIETRVNQIGKNGKGCSLLLYIDARAAIEILNESFGIYGWQRHHEYINNSLFCTISIWDEDKKMWIDKQDVGSEGSYEKEKSIASDSLKRAAVNIGIAKELYSAPFIWINLRDDEVEPVKSNNFQTNNEPPKYRLKYNVKFTVDTIRYSADRKITMLVIVDQNGECRFTYRNGSYQGDNNQNYNTLPNPVPVNKNNTTPRSVVEQMAAPNNYNTGNNNGNNYNANYNNFNNQPFNNPNAIPTNNYNGNNAFTNNYNSANGINLQTASEIVLQYGEHKGETLGDVKLIDPNYIKELYNNTTSARLKSACDLLMRA